MAWSFRRTRLAPSPTGALHLGHARTFLITWWLARQAGAEIVLRMEDLDAGRARPESVQQAYDDLRWLGMDWDAGPETGHGTGVRISKDEYVQSRRVGVYRAALERLREAGRVYPCTCTRAEIAATVAASVGAPQEGDAQVRYPGICRGKGANGELRVQNGRWTLTEGGIEKPACWRLRVPEGAVEFEDVLAGRQAIDVAMEAGDFPLTRFDGTPAYQLACVVDDAAMGMDAVIRGDDLLASTPRQILLYRALGLEPPRFGHVPLVIGPDGKRLAKRHGESRIAQFRAAGVTAEQVVGWVAWRSGQIAAPRPLAARELVAGFEAARVPREPVVLEAADLAWLAGAGG